MTRVSILILALVAGTAFAEKPSSDLTNVRGFNYTTSLDTSIGPRGSRRVQYCVRAISELSLKMSPMDTDHVLIFPQVDGQRGDAPAHSASAKSWFDKPHLGPWPNPQCRI
jgi:hypothetical protein